MGHSLFSNRRLCIATKHGKESVIAPALETALQVECFVPEDFDTDELGTFSGEVERTGDALATAREKCMRAMELTGCDLAIASEGSFGSHPTLFFIPADEEFLLFMDAKNDIEIVAKFLTTDTNFGGEKVTAWEQVQEFAAKSKFPDHALILKNTEKHWDFIVKGIQSETALKSAFEESMTRYKEAFVETDMRAMVNPMRMDAIAKATEALIKKIDATCPKCNMPGFDVTERRAGLPCSSCSMPTRSTLMHIYRCQHCNFEKIEKFPNGKEQEDPMYCDFCNP